MIDFLLASMGLQSGQSGFTAASAVAHCLTGLAPPEQMLQAALPLLQTLMSDEREVRCPEKLGHLQLPKARQKAVGENRTTTPEPTCISVNAATTWPTFLGSIRVIDQT